VYFERFGWHTREEYDAFLRIYGVDVMAWLDTRSWQTLGNASW